MRTINEPWAKTNSTGETRSVIEHCLDVAHTVDSLLSREIECRRLGSAFGVKLSDVHISRLAVLAGLHDFGKCLKGFQDKLDARPGLSSGHVAEALAAVGAFPEIRDAVGINLLKDWFGNVTDVLYATICHHGEPIEESRLSQHLANAREMIETTRHGHQPIEQIARLRESLVRAFPAALQSAEPLTFTTEAQHLFAGILMTADWMASGFAFEPGGRRALAEGLLQATGWSGWHSGAAPTGILGGWEPRAAQAALDCIPLENLVVVEAPTGTGKTEAALIWTSRLVAAGLVDGLYFAVPTRSAATELHSRIGRVMGEQHPMLRGKIVRAVPGMLDVDDQRPDYPPETWAVAAPKQVFAAPIAVGTIDQALLSIIRTRHAWLRASLVSRHLLVIDEVHASDPYMAALTNALVRRHLKLGGYALAMSATLGETALATLQNRERRPFKEAERVVYPSVRQPSSDTPLGGAERRLTHISLIAHQDAIAAAVDAASAGQSVLLIRSTVEDAVSDFTAVSARASALLHHSRYALEDRTWLDGQLLGIFGPRGQRRGVVAVTTQTAEQSLDIDADLLITDACPADVLLQRLGRLHRHRQGTEPRAYVIDPGPLDAYIDPNGKVCGKKNQGWPWVYQNLLSVRETLRWISEHSRIIVPQDSRVLVERATHADYLREQAEEAGSNWQALWRRLYQKSQVQVQLANAGLVDWTKPYREAVINDQYATRLGEGSVTVQTAGLISPFTGRAISALPIPGRWLAGLDEINHAAVRVSEGRFMIGGLTFLYSAIGLQRRRA